MTYLKALLIAVFSLCSFAMTAQPEANLARQYFDNAEYEKAEVMFEKLYKEQPTNDYYFQFLLKCLIEQEKYDGAEDLIKKRIKSNPKNAWLYAEYGQLLMRREQPEKAKEQFKKGIDNLPADQNEIIRLANSFVLNTQFDLAAETYEKGGQLLNNKLTFSYELAEVYRQKGDVTKMIENYLNSLDFMPTRMTNVQAYFQRSLDPGQFQQLQDQLIERAQLHPESEMWPEMLAWVYMQRKDFKNAFRQIKALDSRLQENGGRVFQLAQKARQEKDYESAIDGYRYIVDKKGSISPFYFDAKYEILNCRKEQVTEGYAYTDEQLRTIEAEYEGFLTEFGRNKQTANIISEYSKLEAFYLRDLDKAIALMQEIVDMPLSDRNSNEQRIRNQAKLDLGDFYLMQGDEWEATLLYSQVDKALKDAPLGEYARFKNAKLSYYQGEFEWAQGQLDALKASTTDLISNDAIDLSVFIMDSYGLDTTAVPMQMYAHAELLNFQNRFEESFLLMDSIEMLFPKHAILDHVFFNKADIYIKQRQYAKAQPLLDSIIENYKEGILVDNAIFTLAKLYENPNQLNDKEKAKTLYEKIITDFSSSIFVIEARKRFRFLRGDNVESVPLTNPGGGEN